MHHFSRLSGSLQNLLVDFCFMFLPVLSHLAAPWRVLKRLASDLPSSKGWILGSTPGLCLVNDLLT